MTNTVYPQEKAIESIKGGIATVRQGAMRIESAVVAGEDIRAQFGGMGEARYTESNLRALWTPAEKQNFRDFLRYYRRLLRTYEPTLRKEIKCKMIARFKTANPRKYEAILNEGLLNNPRLDITKKDGRTLHVSVNEQKAYSEQRSALGWGARKS